MTSIDPGPSFVRDGFAIVPALVDGDRCDQLLRLLPAPQEPARLRRLLDLPPVARLAIELTAHASIAALLPPGARAVQCTFFDKATDRNWSVGPHQDLSLPLPPGARRLPQGWRGASHKDGIDFGQPQAAELERVLAVRVQLDSMVADEGALEVIPGTHCRGRIEPHELADLALTATRVPCPVPRGGALLLRPLLVHGSRRLRAGARRRVLHFVFAAQEAA